MRVACVAFVASGWCKRMDLEAIGVLLLAGAVTGFAGGISGGGAPFAVALLILILPAFGVAGPDVGRIAGATSVAIVLLLTLKSFTTHLSLGRVDWRMLAQFGPSLLAGTVLAALVAPTLEPAVLAFGFSAFAMFMSWRLFSQPHPRPGAEARALALAAHGFVGGALATLLGTGIGLIAIPMMARIMPMALAVGTNAALAAPIALVGATTYLLAPKGCAVCVGYVHVPAVAAMGLSAVLAVPFGVWAGAIIPESTVRALLAAILLLAAGNLLYRSIDTAAIAQHAHRLIASIQNSVGGRGTPIGGGVPQWLQQGDGDGAQTSR